MFLIRNVKFYKKGGRGVAKIGVFTTASADPLDSAAYYIDIFVNIYGAANATYIPVTESSNNANDPFVAELTRQQTGFFFGGGDQSRVLKALRPKGRDTLVLTAVKDMLKAGATVGGTSAGAACLVKSNICLNISKRNQNCLYVRFRAIL
jgi:cyanophycinase